MGGEAAPAPPKRRRLQRRRPDHVLPPGPLGVVVTRGAQAAAGGPLDLVAAADQCSRSIAPLRDGRLKIDGDVAFTLIRCKVKVMTRISSKNQVTLPVEALRRAGLGAGDEVTVRPTGDGELVIAVHGSRVRRHAGIATGIYAASELDRLRDEWER